MVCKLCIHNSKKIGCYAGVIRIYDQKGMIYPIACKKFEPIQDHLFGGAEVGY